MTVTILAPAFTPDRRPTCPSWCDGTCQEWDDELHTAPTIRVPVTAEKQETSAFVAVELGRIDRNGDLGPIDIDIYVDKAGTHVGDHAKMSPNQARNVGAALFAVADTADGATPLADLIRAYGQEMAAAGAAAGSGIKTAPSYYASADQKLAEIVKRLETGR